MSTNTRFHQMRNHASYVILYVEVLHSSSRSWCSSLLYIKWTIFCDDYSTYVMFSSTMSKQFEIWSFSMNLSFHVLPKFKHAISFPNSKTPPFNCDLTMFAFQSGDKIGYSPSIANRVLFYFIPCCNYMYHTLWWICLSSSQILSIICCWIMLISKPPIFHLYCNLRATITSWSKGWTVEVTFGGKKIPKWYLIAQMLQIHQSWFLAHCEPYNWGHCLTKLGIFYNLLASSCFQSSTNL